MYLQTRYSSRDARYWMVDLFKLRADFEVVKKWNKDEKTDILPIRISINDASYRTTEEFLTLPYRGIEIKQTHRLTDMEAIHVIQRWLENGEIEFLIVCFFSYYQKVIEHFRPFLIGPHLQSHFRMVVR
uniref:Uncharacterized protein n=1 Tax=Caenorhabditis japonica TaxID=281687 RepID=A0A8R1IKP8_CAEJA